MNNINLSDINSSDLIDIYKIVEDFIKYLEEVKGEDSND